MKRFLLAASLVFVPSLLVQGLLADGLHAQDTVKIGIVMPYSGQFADPTTQGDNGVKLYLKQHGNILAGKKVEIIRKDVGGINPPVAKRLAQELVTRDNVDILARLSADTQRDGRRRRFRRGQEVHGGYERGDRHRHHQVALHGARLVHHSAAQPDARHLGGAKARAEERLHHGHRLRPWHRCRGRLSERLQGGRRAASSARCAWRCKVRISRPMCSAPRISIRKAFSS